jgi:hypothetical protein
MLLIYGYTSININMLVKFNVHIHVIKQNYDIGTPSALHVLEYLTFYKLIRLCNVVHICNEIEL